MDGTVVGVGAVAGSGSWTLAARQYLALTKPGIVIFIGITAAGGFLLGAGGAFSPWLLVHAVLATMLAAAGAAGLNQVRERRADALMRRTSRRPLVSGALDARSAAAFAVGLSVSGIVYAALLLPWQATLLIALSHFSYVVIYTSLKQRTPWCTVVGAVPGALPVLAGWTASGAPVTWGAVALFGLLFLWQMPHFLAIGWLYREDYARGGFRVLSVDDPSGRRSGRVALLYALALLPVSVVPWWTGVLGPGYLIGALLLAALYAAAAAVFAGGPTPARARRLFFASLIYVPALMAVAVIGAV
jgi:heme o synthase